MKKVIKNLAICVATMFALLMPTHFVMWKTQVDVPWNPKNDAVISRPTGPFSSVRYMYSYNGEGVHTNEFISRNFLLTPTYRVIFDVEDNRVIEIRYYRYFGGITSSLGILMDGSIYYSSDDLPEGLQFMRISE